MGEDESEEEKESTLGVALLLSLTCLPKEQPTLSSETALILAFDALYALCSTIINDKITLCMLLVARSSCYIAGPTPHRHDAHRSLITGWRKLGPIRLLHLLRNAAAAPLCLIT